MSGFDQGRVFYSSVLPVADKVNSTDRVEERFVEFLREFRVDNHFVYRDQLRTNYNTKNYYVEIDLRHLVTFDELLASELTKRPAEILPLFENAAKTLAHQLNHRLLSGKKEHVIDIQVHLRSSSQPLSIRSLSSEYVSKLVQVPGIIISASTISAKATRLHIMCRSCSHVKQIPVKRGFGGAQLPRTCESQSIEANKGNESCPVDPYVIIPDKCQYVDQQTLKLQEAPDMVPVGELPRHLLLYADRYLTNKIVPGTRVNIIGIYSIFQNRNSKGSSAASIRSPYVRVVGIQTMTEGIGRLTRAFSEEEEAEFLQLARQPDIYTTFAKSIAPSIFGMEDVKKAICCLLFGGSRRILPDGMRLRGDINVLLLGDPGTAKSQVLKFVEKVAPIAVYTSGKGSSAAGLTASVIRDANTNDFYLEGGAMVLADGGVVCIDEFDKMRDEDRVAIHEAMEQQTISIAKAGITTILNSRTSVLAAANPVFGRFDDLKSTDENIDFQTTILSRFDMIFIVKDEHHELRDLTLAKHVINIHKNANAPEGPSGDIDIRLMRNYISYCKSKCAPRLSPAAAEKLINHFVTIRDLVRSRESESEKRSTIPITVRQLEAITRIAESVAKMELSPLATEAHVEEAIRLFKFSTMQAIESGQMLEGMARPDQIKAIQDCETLIRRRLPIGSQASVKKIEEDLEKQGAERFAIQKAIAVMLGRDELQHRAQRKLIYRVK